MTTNQCDIGLIGLGVMGENLVLNMASKGFSVAVFNRTTEVTEKFAAGRAKEKSIQPTKTMEEFAGALKRPRKVMIMVKAGAPVDAVIGQLAPLLEKGDVIIDGGNSLFTDTQRRCKDLEGRAIHFVGCGVSGGEEGALKGPSLMPGGSRESWEMIAPIFRKIAAQVDGEPCCRYMGPDGAGHYVKMVHNGIEYGDMQLICEAYAILKNVLWLEAKDLADIFAQWNRGALESYLIEITAEIFRKQDPDTGKALVDVILDKAGQKGTGLWILETSRRFGVEGASFARNFLTASPRLMRAIRSYTISCSTNISPTSSQKHNTIGASRSQPPLITAWPRPPSALPWRTSTAIVPRVCRRIYCKRSAISSARIPISASTSREFSTPIGSVISQPRKSVNRNRHRSATPANDSSAGARN